MKKCIVRVKQGYTQTCTIICHTCCKSFPTWHDFVLHREVVIIKKSKKRKTLEKEGSST